MRHLGRTVARELARVARSSHGVVTRAQLLAAGITVDEINRQLRSGALLREHRGVYRVGHRAPSVDARYLAAVLACGEWALLSGPAAGHLFGAVKGPAPPPEVTAPTERRVKGVRTHRSRGLSREDGTRFRGIPVTTLPRTLVDLAAVLDLDDLARACHEAGVRYGTTPAQVQAVLGRRRGSPGAAKLRLILDGDAAVTLSRLERRFLALLREAGLPRPEANRPAGTKYADCRWPGRSLTHRARQLPLPQLPSRLGGGPPPRA
jgi:hypothetical protein